MNKATIPIIRIQSSYLLEDRFGLPKINEKAVKEYQRAWKKYEKTLLPAMQAVTSLTFAQNIIDVYVVNPSGLGGMSDPIIIGGGMTTDRFVFVLAHELIHRLMFDNTQKTDWHEKAWRMYPKETHMVAHHVIVHAVLDKVFRKTKNTAMTNKDVNISEQLPEYKRAWDIAKKEGYENVLKKLK